MEKKIIENSQILSRARDLKFAIPHFNYSDFWEFIAIVEASIELKAPVFTATNMQSFKEQKKIFPSVLGKAAEEYYSIPIVNHLDHSRDIDLCKEAIDYGYKSVMIDCSTLSFEENIRQTKEVVAYAHPKNAIVEAELGLVLGSNEEGNYEGDDFLVDPDSVQQFVAETGVDSLAIGVGTAHGFYKSAPRIRFDVIGKVREKTDIPLVLHGCSGVPKEDVQKAIKLGMCKVNIGTQLHYNYMTTVYEQLQKNIPNNINVFANILPAVEKIKEAVKFWIKVCGAEGKVSKL